VPRKAAAMRTLYLILGPVLVAFGVFVKYIDQYLARKQEELRRKGRTDVNLYWPAYGPRPMMGPALIICGLIMVLLYFLKM
jgi:hypothetical protein